MSLICKRCLVSGRVQRVAYRALAASRAKSLGITGFAHNLADGRVEVLACGEVDAVEAFIGWLWRGPTLARVEQVDVSDDDAPPPPQFSTG
jgi:acylphosphatase